MAVGMQWLSEHPPWGYEEEGGGGGAWVTIVRDDHMVVIHICVYRYFQTASYN